MKTLAHLLQHPDISRHAPDESSASIIVHNPFNGETLAHIRPTAPENMAHIINNAQNAQRAWQNISPLARADTLWTWHAAIMRHQESLARLLTLEQGKPLAESRGEIAYAASFVRWFAEEAQRIEGSINIAPSRQKIMVIKQPVGVCAAITPWNFPAAMVTRKVAPALAAGCAMILKPARQTPLSSYALANLAYESGIAPELLPVVCGDSRSLGAAFTQNPIVRKISFTGSTETGATLYRDSAAHIKKLSLELGGNAAALVFDDADLTQAVSGIIAAKFRNSGQTCVCVNRVYVQAAIYDAFCERLAKSAAQLILGNGLDDGVQQGPLIDKNATEKVAQHIKDALDKGAQCLTGGKPSALGGHFFEPTVLRDCTADMRCAHEETFGPLCPVFRFEDESEAIAAANDTEFGLAGYIFTRDSARMWRVAEALECGMVGINTGIISHAQAPFGGIKASGLGREGGRYGIEEYLEMKYLCMDLNAAQ